MRSPEPPDTPVDSQRLSCWVERFAGYREEVTRPRIRSWLDQFYSGDRDLAARVLDSVEYVSDSAMQTAFKSILGRLPGWDKRAKRRKGQWRFVAFSRAAGESGDAMLHKWRSATGLKCQPIQ